MQLREDAVHFSQLSEAAREGIRLFLADNNPDRVAAVRRRAAGPRMQHASASARE